MQGSKSVKILIYLPSRTLSNLMCSHYIYGSKWVDSFWLVKALCCIVEGGQNDSHNQSKMPPSVYSWFNRQKQLEGYFNVLQVDATWACTLLRLDVVSKGYSNAWIRFYHPARFWAVRTAWSCLRLTVLRSTVFCELSVQHRPPSCRKGFDSLFCEFMKTARGTSGLCTA